MKTKERFNNCSSPLGKGEIYLRVTEQRVNMSSSGKKTFHVTKASLKHVIENHTFNGKTGADVSKNKSVFLPFFQHYQLRSLLVEGLNNVTTFENSGIWPDSESHLIHVGCGRKRCYKQYRVHFQDQVGFKRCMVMEGRLISTNDLLMVVDTFKWRLVTAFPV